MSDIFDSIKKEFKEQEKLVKDIKSLDDFITIFFGRKGKLAEAMKGIAEMSVEEKKKVGMAANEVKKELEEKISALREKILDQNESFALLTEAVDLTEPPLPALELGHEHPSSIVRLELEDWFKQLGFSVLDGPEIESEYFNFEALNIPKHHPSRDTQDTFYIADVEGQVMRTQTSPMQVRAMLKYGAPLRAVVPGRVFRNEATDVRHEHTFDQLEGIMVDKNISIGHLIGVMKQVLQGVFKTEVDVRLRPGHFNFVEPGFEMDMKCLACKGAGCGICKHTGYLEVVGCGLIHPSVLEAGKIDPDKYSGFAFGFGLTRLVMMRYKIEDIRLLNSADIKFLRQF